VVQEKSRKTDTLAGGQLEQRLAEAIAKQAATSQILKVISHATLNLQLVPDTVVGSATRLCGATRGHIFRFDGELLRFAAAYGAWPDFKDFLEHTQVPRGFRRDPGSPGLPVALVSQDVLACSR
jgi:hypothetical protein